MLKNIFLLATIFILSGCIPKTTPSIIEERFSNQKRYQHLIVVQTFHIFHKLMI